MPFLSKSKKKKGEEKKLDDEVVARLTAETEKLKQWHPCKSENRRLAERIVFDPVIHKTYLDEMHWSDEMKANRGYFITYQSWSVEYKCSITGNQCVDPDCRKCRHAPIGGVDLQTP